MPAKQKTKKPSKIQQQKQQELSESSDDEQVANSHSDDEESSSPVRTRSSKRLSQKSLDKISKHTSRLSKTIKEAKPKKQRRFLSLNEEAKISATNAKLLSYIVGKKNPISRTELTARAKKYLQENEEFNELKITIAALNSLSLIMNHKFGSLFNIAGILASYKDVQTITALELEFAKKIIDGKLSSINSNPNEFIKMFCNYKDKITPIKNPDPYFADKIYSEIQTHLHDKEVPAQADITKIFSDPRAIKEIEQELAHYNKPILK